MYPLKSVHFTLAVSLVPANWHASLGANERIVGAGSGQEQLQQTPRLLGCCGRVSRSWQQVVTAVIDGKSARAQTLQVSWKYFHGSLHKLLG